MTPKLYGILPSPPVRAVLMCAKVLDVELELVPVNLMEREHLKEDFLKKNPQHTIPLFEDEDGFIVPDSHAIMAYLVAQYGKDDSLYPKNDYKLRATIDHKLHFDSGVLFNRGISLSRPLLVSGTEPTQEKIDALKEAFQIVDTILEKNNTEYIAGNNLTIADFSIFTSVTTFDLFTPFAEFPNLKAYVERIQKLPCSEINQEGLAMVKIMFTDALNKIKNKV